METGSGQGYLLLRGAGTGAGGECRSMGVQVQERGPSWVVRSNERVKNIDVRGTSKSFTSLVELLSIMLVL